MINTVNGSSNQRTSESTPYYSSFHPAAVRVHERARFAATVRLVKDLRSEDDIRFLLGCLPPWVTAPEWERGETVQVLIGLLWPAINSTVCSLLKRELEERIQENSDFGHITFSRLSFGKHPPAVVGIKAVPLHGEDLLAMVVDLDVRWAGEPDVVLHLTKLRGASLGLSGVQLSAIVRLVFSPITENPPFLSRMTVSFLQRPYVDFSVRALGGPDLMTLPAISTWLRSVVLNLADRAIVWPKEVGVPLVPPSHNNRDDDASSLGGPPLPPPLGVLTVKVVTANIQPRRSTFLGRIKLPNPRVALLMPPTLTSGETVEAGVIQAGLTGVKHKTLHPSWQQEFYFVISDMSQSLCLLLSHRRTELLFTDMPLGITELGAGQLLRAASPREDYSDCSDHSEFASATSSVTSTPRRSVGRSASMRPLVSWASPVTPHLSGLQDVSIMSQDCSGQSIQSPFTPQKVSVVWSRAASSPLPKLVTQQQSMGEPVAVTNPESKRIVLEQITSVVTPQKPVCLTKDERWFVPQGVWVEVPVTDSVTMSGMVSNAVKPRASHKKSSNDVFGRPLQMSQSEEDDGEESEGWFQSLSSLLLGQFPRGDILHSDEGDGAGDDAKVRGQHAQTTASKSQGTRSARQHLHDTSMSMAETSAGKIKLVLRWNPVCPSQNVDCNSTHGSAGPGDKVTKSTSDPDLKKESTTASGVLAIRVSYTKLDYGDSPNNPILALSIGSTGSSMAGTGGPLATLPQVGSRTVSMDAQGGGRPGLLHWGKVFYLPVWNVNSARARLELGEAASLFKLSSYGPDLYSLDACHDFYADVDVKAAAWIPLKDVVSRGFVRGTWRLRESRIVDGVSVVSEDDRLDIGRAAVVMAWFPLE